MTFRMPGCVELLLTTCVGVCESVVGAVLGSDVGVMLKGCVEVL